MSYTEVMWSIRHFLLAMKPALNWNGVKDMTRLSTDDEQFMFDMFEMFR